MGTSEARSKLWDRSLGSLKVALDRGVHPRGARFFSRMLVITFLSKFWGFFRIQRRKRRFVGVTHFKQFFSPERISRFMARLGMGILSRLVGEVKDIATGDFSPPSFSIGGFNGPLGLFKFLGKYKIKMHLPQLVKINYILQHLWMVRVCKVESTFSLVELFTQEKATN